jgi:hypothetical protein
MVVELTVLEAEHFAEHLGDSGGATSATAAPTWGRGRRCTGPVS